MKLDIPQDLAEILRSTPELKRSYLVGGCVRDALLGIGNKDFDIEVFGLDYEELAASLKRSGKVDLVGRSFGVVKLTTAVRNAYDFSIPRRDSKVSAGHKGFAVAFDPALSLEEAAARRDYTINSMMFDVRDGRLIDFFGGERDLREQILRHTGAAFPEDPLRVLRGMQFAARFNLTAAPQTIEMAQSIRDSYRELARERVREEWFKWAEKSVTPSLGIKFLAETRWIEHFPELAALRGVPQDPEWHPEGDVYTHTMHCCDALAKLEGWRSAPAESRIVYMLATLTHDFGKAGTTSTAIKNGVPRIVSPGHECLSGSLAERFLERINAPLRVRDRIIPLVVNHMAYYENVTDRAIRRLAKRLEPENISGLLLVMTADAMGRPPLPRVIPETVRAITAKAEELNVRQAAPAPILLGRHLLELGFSAGPQLGEILNAAYQAQLEGRFGDMPGALAWVKNHPLHTP